MHVRVRALVAGALVLGTVFLAPSAAAMAPSTGGTLDKTFGNGGKTYADFGAGKDTEMAADLAVAGNGKVVAAGTVTAGGRSQWAVARWTDAGTVDKKFSSNGRAVTVIGGSDSARTVVLRGSGRVLVGGTSDGRFALVGYTSDGRLDRGWGGDGIVTTDIPAGDAVVLGLRLVGDGSVLAAGPAGDRLAIARYGPDGEPDPTYGVGGVVTSAQPFGGVVNGVQLQPDGGLFATGVGDIDQAGLRSVRTVEVDAAGLPDPTFGTAGGVTTDVEESDGSLGRSVVVQPDGTVLVGGSAYGPGDYRYYLLVRYLPDGTLDTGFGGGDGYADGLYDYYSQYNDLALQPNGKILAAGWARGEDPDRVAIARFTASGASDRTFNAKGYRTVAFGAGSTMVPPSQAEASAVAVSGGHVYSVGGVDYVNGVRNAKFVLLRLKQN